MLCIQMFSTYITAFKEEHFLFTHYTKNILTYPIKQVNRYTHVLKNIKNCHYLEYKCLCVKKYTNIYNPFIDTQKKEQQHLSFEMMFCLSLITSGTYIISLTGNKGLQMLNSHRVKCIISKQEIMHCLNEMYNFHDALLVFSFQKQFLFDQSISEVSCISIAWSLYIQRFKTFRLQEIIETKICTYF